MTGRNRVDFVDSLACLEGVDLVDLAGGSTRAERSHG
jgi:hypothetical protein